MGENNNFFHPQGKVQDFYINRVPHRLHQMNSLYFAWLMLELSQQQNCTLVDACLCLSLSSTTYKTVMHSEADMHVLGLPWGMGIGYRHPSLVS